MKNLNVFTDGGCSGNPGPGGWAFVILDDSINVISKGSGGEKDTTNNKMELTAVISAIKQCKLLNCDSITINTDSQYVKNGITDWINNWKKNGWKNANKKSVKNQELWQELDSLNLSSKISWTWVKGHAGIEFNEMCDSMVNEEMNKLK